MTFSEDLQAIRERLLSAENTHDLVLQDRQALQAEIAAQKADNDALRRQLAECQEGQPEEPDVALARLLFNVRLREGPGVSFGVVLPDAMQSGSIIPLFEARALGVFHDTEIITPDTALKLTPGEVGSGEVWARVEYQNVTGWAAVIYAGETLMEAVGEAPDPEPEPEPEPTGAPFGPYYARLDEEHLAADIIRAKVPVALLNIGENEAIGGIVAKRALEDDPDRIVIIRNTRKLRPDPNKPEVPLEHHWNYRDHSIPQCALDYWGYMQPVLDSWGLTADQKARVFVMPCNEWDGWEPAPEKFSEARATALMRMNEYYLELMERAQGAGYRLCLYSLPEGNPEKSEWDYGRNSLTNASLYGHIVGLHSYFEAHNGPHGVDDAAYILRHRDLFAKCDEWGIDRPRIVLTELALTSALHDGVGYRGMGMPIEEMMGYVRLTAPGLDEDGVLACLFAQSPYADPWGSYDFGHDRQVFYDTLADWNTVNP